MVHIKIKKGVDIPVKGKPSHWGTDTLPAPRHISLNLASFTEIAFKMLVHVEDEVKLGQPLVEDQACPGRFFVAPAGGVIREIRRGLKRRLLDIVIEVSPQEDIIKFNRIDVSQILPSDLVEHLKQGGLFTHIRQRPFNYLANSNKIPRSIFVKALESAPLSPPAELQVEGYEMEFQIGLDALSKLSHGNVHLVCHHQTGCKAFKDAKGVKIHTAEGPHPISNVSVHIQKIDPILSVEDVVWTVNTHDVIAIGYFLQHGYYFISRVISVAGPAILEDKIGYFRAREGFPIASLISGRVQSGCVRFISGDPLMGHQVDSEDFLGFNDNIFCAFVENERRQFLHFLRLGADKYTCSGAYLSGHYKQHNDYDFTTSQHGEHRPFVDGAVYDHVMPLNIPTMLLVKAVLAEDYDLAVQLGLLEVDGEDFALPSFVCPSKIEMIDIIKNGLNRYANDLLK